MTRQTRHHSCGEPLNSVLAFEVIPAGQYAYKNGHFLQVVSDLDGDDVDLEFKCVYCLEVLAPSDRRWFLQHREEEEDELPFLPNMSSGGTGAWQLAST